MICLQNKQTWSDYLSIFCIFFLLLYEQFNWCLSWCREFSAFLSLNTIWILIFFFTEVTWDAKNFCIFFYWSHLRFEIFCILSDFSKNNCFFSDFSKKRCEKNFASWVCTVKKNCIFSDFSKKNYLWRGNSLKQNIKFPKRLTTKNIPLNIYLRHQCPHI